MSERWVTADEVVAARQRFVAAIPGWQQPTTYGVARVDHDGLVFAHVNEPGGTHLLPAVVLATVCGHVAGNATYVLDRAALARAIALLEPAEACTEFDHPNLWSWRPLLDGASGDATFVAVFVTDLDAPPVDAFDEALRARLA